MDAISSPGPAMIEPLDCESHTILPGGIAQGVILLCDHATNILPPEYGTLGLPPPQLERHIAYDIGADGVTRAMAAQLNAPAVLSKFSRLLIDPNRGDDDPTLVMRISDGAVIAGNRYLNATERERRVARFYAPYHNAIAGLIDTFLAAGTVPVLVSMHSFTHVWKGTDRPWHAGILWDKDPRFAVPLIAALAQDTALTVGDNEPYSGDLRGDTLWKHGTQRGIAHALIEVRQDLIATPDGQHAWATRLSKIVASLLADPTLQPRLQTLEHFGSRTDIG